MKTLITVLFNLFNLALYAQDLSLFQKVEYTGPNGKVMPYRILYPENYDKDKKYPLVLFLHGAGERGTDNEKQLTHGVKTFLADKARHDFPCFVLAPQCPAEDYWGSVAVVRGNGPLQLDFDYARPATNALLSAIGILNTVTSTLAVNPRKVYVAGLSMGGMGTFEAVYRYPEIFAAAVAVCGGGDTVAYDKRVKKIPFRIFHGDQDQTVLVKNSRAMVKRLKEIKAKVTYTEYAGINHNSWDKAFAEPELLPWLFANKKKKAPKTH